MDIEKDFVHLARLALDGRTDDVELLVRRSLRHILKARPDLSPAGSALLERITASPVRELRQPIPVDSDSRLELLRREDVPELAIEPTWADGIRSELQAVVDERVQEPALTEAGLTPTRTMLFVGPPGVGKTLAARWIASRLARPLLVLDLAAVMSSFLGRTGNNLRTVLDYARREPAVLLLDEFDAIAKRRDDATEVGELKRLVTVLLQAVDDWPARGLLIAATNHPELLDPASWRRFERVVKFPPPTRAQVEQAMDRLGVSVGPVRSQLADVLVGRPYSEVTRIVAAAKRDSVLRGIRVDDALLAQGSSLMHEAPLDRKLTVARALASRGLSQREISTVTGLSRDTIRKHRTAGNGRKRGG